MDDDVKLLKTLNVKVLYLSSMEERQEYITAIKNVLKRFEELERLQKKPKEKTKTINYKRIIQKLTNQNKRSEQQIIKLKKEIEILKMDLKRFESRTQEVIYEN